MIFFAALYGFEDADRSMRENFLFDDFLLFLKEAFYMWNG